MSIPDAEKWAKLSKLGRNKFVLRFGVLGWGVPTGLLFSLIQGFEYGWDGFLFRLIPALILFPLGGILFGRIMWRMLEKKHGAVPPASAAK